MQEIFLNPTCRWVAIGGAFRFFGGYAIGFYMPQYFGKFDGPNDSNIYAYGNAIVISMCGFASALLGGIISDKFEKKGYLTIKSSLVIGSSLLGIPFIVLCTCVQSSIWFSIVMLGFEYLVAECWISPAITMLINTISPENKAFGTSAFLFFCTISGTISTSLLGALQKHYDVKNHKELYGYILCAFVVFAYAGCVPFFFLAGKSYKAVMLARKQAESDM